MARLEAAPAPRRSRFLDALFPWHCRPASMCQARDDRPRNRAAKRGPGHRRGEPRERTLGSTNCSPPWPPWGGRAERGCASARTGAWLEAKIGRFSRRSMQTVRRGPVARSGRPVDARPLQARTASAARPGGTSPAGVDPPGSLPVVRGPRRSGRSGPPSWMAGGIGSISVRSTAGGVEPIVWHLLGRERS